MNFIKIEDVNISIDKDSDAYKEVLSLSYSHCHILSPHWRKFSPMMSLCPWPWTPPHSASMFEATVPVPAGGIVIEDTVFSLILSSTKAWKRPLETSPEQTVPNDDEFLADIGHHPIPAEEEQTSLSSSSWMTLNPLSQIQQCQILPHKHYDPGVQLGQFCRQNFQCCLRIKVKRVNHSRT